MKKIIHDVFLEIHNSAKATCKISGMPSGFIQLDFYTRGFFPGNVYIFAGAPRSLKTSLLLQISYFMGVECPYHTKFLSMDSRPEVLIRRMLFAACNISATTFPYESPDLIGMQRLFAAGRKLENSNFKFICNSTLMLEDIENECKENEEKGVIVIDYLQMLSYGKKKHIILRRLKDIAIKYNVAMLLIYEINYKSRINKEFFLRNGVDSIFLMENETTFELDEETGYVLFQILKQKNGQSAEFFLKFIKNSMKFYDDELDLFESPHLFDDESLQVC